MDGGSPLRLRVKMAGGANMLQAPGFSNSLDIGGRNVAAAMECFRKLNIKLIAKEVGGHHGRTVRLFVSNGRMTLRSMGNPEPEF